jgi:hypothetical protein
MMNLIKNHWCCWLLGMVAGWSLQFCPLLQVGHLSGEKACQCETCCDPCDCVEACTDDNCPCCVKH